MKNIIKLTIISAVTAVFFSGCIMHTLGTTTVGAVSGKKVAKDLWYWGNGQKPKGLLNHDGMCRKSEEQFTERIAKNIERANRKAAKGTSYWSGGSSFLSGPTEEHPYVHITDMRYVREFRDGVYMKPVAFGLKSLKCDLHNKKLIYTYITHPSDMDELKPELKTKKEKRVGVIKDIYGGLLEGTCLTKAPHYAMDEAGYEIVAIINNVDTKKPVAILKINYDDCYEYLYNNNYYMFDDPKKMEKIKQRKAQLKEPRVQIFEENLFVGLE